MLGRLLVQSADVWLRLCNTHLNLVVVLSYCQRVIPARLMSSLCPSLLQASTSRSTDRPSGALHATPVCRLRHSFSRVLVGTQLQHSRTRRRGLQSAARSSRPTVAVLEVSQGTWEAEVLQVPINHGLVSCMEPVVLSPQPRFPLLLIPGWGDFLSRLIAGHPGSVMVCRPASPCLSISGRPGAAPASWCCRQWSGSSRSMVTMSRWSRWRRIPTPA